MSTDALTSYLLLAFIVWVAVVGWAAAVQTLYDPSERLNAFAGRVLFGAVVPAVLLVIAVLVVMLAVERLRSWVYAWLKPST